jgi:hypothetical protein
MEESEDIGKEHDTIEEEKKNLLNDNHSLNRVK